MVIARYLPVGHARLEPSYYSQFVVSLQSFMNLSWRQSQAKKESLRLIAGAVAPQRQRLTEIKK